MPAIVRVPCSGEVWLNQHHVAGKPQAVVRPHTPVPAKPVLLAEEQMVLSKTLSGGTRDCVEGP